MKLKWMKYYHTSGRLGSVEASIVKASFPGLSDTHTAVVLSLEGGNAMAYVRMNAGQMGESTMWADRTFRSVRAAQGWAKSLLERI